MAFDVVGAIGCIGSAGEAERVGLVGEGGALDPTPFAVVSVGVSSSSFEGDALAVVGKEVGSDFAGLAGKFASAGLLGAVGWLSVGVPFDPPSESLGRSTMLFGEAELAALGGAAAFDVVGAAELDGKGVFWAPFAAGPEGGSTAASAEIGLVVGAGVGEARAAVGSVGITGWFDSAGLGGATGFIGERGPLNPPASNGPAGGSALPSAAAGPAMEGDEVAALGEGVALGVADVVGAGGPAATSIA